MLRNDAAEVELLATVLTEAVRRDGTGDFRDEAIFELASTIRASEEPGDRLTAAAILIGLARRVEYSSLRYPSLIRAAADLASEHTGTAYEKALHTSNTIIRPLAEAYIRDE